MMAGNPNYWSMNDMHPLQLSNSPQFVYASNNNSSSLLTSQSTADHQDYPVRSWSQLLLGGGGDQEERYEGHDQLLNLNNSIIPPNSFPRINNPAVVEHHDHHQAISRTWPRVVPVSSSATSCVTSLSNNNNFLSFSGAGAARENSSECNSTSTGGVAKKARVQQSSSQPPLKVRKEKLGDRITALHQLVSPFGKTDTASVLSEAIGYIRFLQAQIQALSTPYMRNPSANSVQELNCLFPEEGVGEDSESREAKDLRSRGLCLVPISCTDNVGDHDNGADYWAPTALGGAF